MPFSARYMLKFSAKSVADETPVAYLAATQNQNRIRRSEATPTARSASRSGRFGGGGGVQAHLSIFAYTIPPRPAAVVLFRASFQASVAADPFCSGKHEREMIRSDESNEWRHSIGPISGPLRARLSPFILYVRPDLHMNQTYMIHQTYRMTGGDRRHLDKLEGRRHGLSWTTPHTRTIHDLHENPHYDNSTRRLA
jgi:hypothetical protein